MATAHLPALFWLLALGGPLTDALNAKVENSLVAEPSSEPTSQWLDVRVVNVNNCTRRMANMTRRLNDANISYSRVEAFSPETLPYGRDLGATAQKGIITNRFSMAESVGSLACALSHMSIYHELASGADEEAVLVLEDDVQIADDLIPRAQMFFTNSPDFDILLLGWFHEYTNPSSMLDVPDHPALVQLSNDYDCTCATCWQGGQTDWCIDTGMSGYIVTKRGAARLLEILTPLHEVIDVQIGRYSKNITLLALRPGNDLLQQTAFSPSVRNGVSEC